MQKVKVIAEIGLSHEGSLGTAMAYVKAIARTGAYAVKFQTHIAEYESSINERFRTNIFPQDETRFEYWNRTAFKSHEWKLLSDYCESLGIIFATTPFSIEAAKLVAPYNKTFWKVGSGDLTNLPLIDYPRKYPLAYYLVNWDGINR